MLPRFVMSVCQCFLYDIIRGSQNHARCLRFRWTKARQARRLTGAQLMWGQLQEMVVRNDCKAAMSFSSIDARRVLRSTRHSSIIQG